MAEWTGQSPKKGKRGRDRSLSRGVTLIEVMLAAAIFALMVMALFEGIAVSARIARENAEYLQADAYAFDLAWKRYNESYAALRGLIPQGTNEVAFPGESITADAAPLLYRPGSSAVSHTTLTRVTDPSDGTSEMGILISVDVEWGPSGDRRLLSSTHRAVVFKGGSEDG